MIHKLKGDSDQSQYDLLRRKKPQLGCGAWVGSRVETGNGSGGRREAPRAEGGGPARKPARLERKEQGLSSSLGAYCQDGRLGPGSGIFPWSSAQKGCAP